MDQCRDVSFVSRSVEGNTIEPACLIRKGSIAQMGKPRTMGVSQFWAIRGYGNSLTVCVRQKISSQCQQCDFYDSSVMYNPVSFSPLFNQ